jgi:predicted porin
MFGGIGKAGWATILVTGGLMLGTSVSAQAADLGGDCCADLEERIAELEATTARKGNRKVSLEVSGHVNEAVMFWDDGVEQNAYIVTNDNSRSRFRFKGKAKIDKDWSAGYLIEIGVRGANSKRSNQGDDEGCGTGVDCGLDIRHSYWFIESKTYGKISVGHTGAASEAITEINLAHTKDIAKYSDVEDSGLGMLLRSSTNGGLSGLSWRRLIGDSGDQPGEGERRNTVKYDSPAFAGFTATAAWGEDDYWDVGLRYEGEHHGFKIAAGIAYGENTDVAQGQTAVNNFRDSFFECMSQGVPPLPNNNELSPANCDQIGGSVSVMHVESGLYANFAAGQLQDNLINQTPQFVGTGADDTGMFWAVEAGIEKKWFDLGKTTLFAQYYDHDGGANNRRTIADADPVNPFAADAGAGAERIFATGVEMVGVGVVQEISNASMLLYTYYRHYEADLTVMQGTAGLGATADAQLEDLDIVMSGAMIKF